MQDTIHQKVIDILMLIMPNYPQDYWQATTELLSALPEFDSMTIVTLLTELEASFDVEFYDDDISADNFATVNDVVLLIESKLNLDEE